MHVIIFHKNESTIKETFKKKSRQRLFEDIQTSAVKKVENIADKYYVKSVYLLKGAY